jgi:hypothetical protein
MLIFTYHFGLVVDFTKGDMPSRYKDFDLLKFTTLKITFCKKIELYKIILK